MANGTDMGGVGSAIGRRGAVAVMTAVAAGIGGVFGALLLASSLGMVVALLLAMLALGPFAFVIWCLWRGRSISLLDQPARMALSAVEEAPNARLIVDRADRLLYHNPAYRRLVGHVRGPVPGPMALFGSDPELAEKVRRLRHQGTGGLDFSRIGPGGERQWLRLSVQRANNGAAAEYWRIEDISAEHELTSTIHAELRRLSDFIDRAPVGFFSADADGRFDFVNATLASWLGLSPEALASGKIRVGDRIRPAPELALGESAEFRRGGEAWLIRADGSEMPVRVERGAAAGQGVSGSSAVVHDLTQELAWRRALRQAEAHFGHFFDFAPIGIVVLDDRDRVTEANKAFLAMLGAGGADALSGSMLDLVAEGDRQDMRERLQATREGRHGGPIEVRLSTRPERVAQVFASRLDPQTAGDSGLLLHLIDTTDQKNLELQFAQSQKMQAVGQLAGGIAHDFNNLLTAMIGFCDLLLLRHQPGDQSFADIMQIKQNANRAANLVRQLLAFSRQQTLRPKVLDITDVLADLSNLLRRLLGETIEFRLVHGRDLGLVKVDQGQFEQVVINLAVNARDAMTDGGELTIRTANVTAEESTRLGHELMPAGEYVLIEVSDTGKGIPKDILGKIFEPFFTTKEVGAGTGLGLSTVYGIIKQTGGFIFPESEVGRGAKFRIYLPRHRQVANREAAQLAEGGEKRPSRDLTGKGTVLLVEDEDAVRIFAARALRNKGYTVLEANSGDAALEQVQRHAGEIDILVSDVVMPNMDGPTLAREIRRRRPDLKIIFISGYAEDAFRRNLDRDVEIDFLPKPFSLKQLAGKVKEVIERESVKG
ncbi:MAG: PAS domain S-box protein [Alphaproteobacteria bacterium]|nr:PAS domain S-box protein [Alphaproteobacteria bacterium]